VSAERGDIAPNTSPLFFFNKAAKLQGKITRLFFVPAISFFLVSVKEDFLRGERRKKKELQ
jgi:hypothetical protein